MWWKWMNGFHAIFVHIQAKLGHAGEIYGDGEMNQMTLVG